MIAAWTEGNLSNFSASLELHLQLIPLVESLGDELLLARALNSLGIIYSDSEQYDLGKKTFEDARRHAEHLPDRRVLASVLNNLGNLTMKRGNVAEARTYHEQSLKLRLENSADARGVADSRQNLAEVAVAENRPADALELLELAIAAHTKLNLKRNLANARLTYAAALTQLHRPQEALAQLESARALTASLGSPAMRERVAQAFATFHESQGDFRSALEWQRKIATAHNEAVGERARQRLERLQAQFDAERRQHQIDTLQRDQTEKAAALSAARWQRLGLLAFIGLGFVTAFAVASRARTRRRAEQRVLAETRAAKEAAEQADALKSRLVGMVSHDIRGPLHNVLHSVEEARHETDPAALAPQLDLIASETRRVTTLAQELLDVAALEAGRLELHRTPIDLAELVRAALGHLEQSAKAKAQTLTFDAGARDDGVLEADAARLTQVVANLVSNAIKYSPRGATIRVSLERAPQSVRLLVRDEGPGIPPEERALLFKPFAKLSARPTAGESSHGLGLSLAHELVRLHGGTLGIECPPTGGSIFVVELPRGA